MLELTIPVYVICLGFIAGSWDHRYQTRSSKGWENENLGQTSEASLSKTSPRLKTETPHSEAIVLITPSLQEGVSTESNNSNHFRSLEYKGVELSEQGK